jgi:hypothetical protein
MNDLMQKKEWSFNTFAWADEQKLPGFGQLLNSWLQVHKNYCNNVRPENSWEYDFKERSQIGFLSNAVVLIGGIALEEWAAKKKSGSGNGRNDLFSRLPTQNQTQDYFIEAKWGAIDLRWTENNVVGKLSEVMGNAIKDAEQLDAKHLIPNDGKAVAVSFFILSFNDEDADSLDKTASTLLNYIQGEQSQRLGLNALASIYFTSEDLKQNRNERKEWPTYEVGLILMAKLVDVT